MKYVCSRKKNRFRMYLIFYNNLSNFYEVKKFSLYLILKYLYLLYRNKNFVEIFFNFLDMIYLHYIYVVYYDQCMCIFPNKNKVVS